MSKYKAGDKVVIEITDKFKNAYGHEYYSILDSIYSTDFIDEKTEPLSTYTKPLEAKIRRQAAEITRLLEENKRLKAENGNSLCNIEQARAEGEQAAWELARKIVDDIPNGGYSAGELKQIFGYAIPESCIVENTYQEAAAQVAEWEKAKEEVKVGDVLEDIADRSVKCVATSLYSNNMAYLVFNDGSAGMHELENMKKTGRHIDIDSFLKQIGGKQE